MFSVGYVKFFYKDFKYAMEKICTSVICLGGYISDNMIYIIIKKFQTRLTDS